MLLGKFFASSFAASAHGVRAKALGQRGENALALAEVDQAIELTPKDPLLFCLRGQLGPKGSTERALADFGRALELAPDLAAAWRDRGVVRFLKGDTAGGIKDLDRAIEWVSQNAS